MSRGYAATRRRLERKLEREAEADGLLYAGRGLRTGYTAEERKSHQRYKKASEAAARRTDAAREAHEHHEVVGIDKAPIKAQIRKLKKDRQAAIDAKDADQLKSVRRELKVGA